MPFTEHLKTVVFISVLHLSGITCFVDNGTNANITTIPSTRPTLKESIVYGLLATTLTNLAALLGLVFAPLNRFRWYPTLISFMVATAVGSLFSTAVLVLIPEALRLTDHPDFTQSGRERWYIPATTSVCAGTLIFFTLEFLLRRMRCYLEKNRPIDSERTNNLTRTTECVVPFPCVEGEELDCTALHGDEGSMATARNNGLCARENNYTDGRRKSLETSVQSAQKLSPNTDKPLTLCSKNFCRRISQLDPVVWMIVVGDGMHNFMDGLSLGAGFSMELRTGLTLMVAILCEELPHELGDFAIMIRSGLAVSTALLFNFLSACTAYFGFFLGIWLGDISQSAVYIFALTAGFFLYIALADMLPEMRHMEDMRIQNNQNVYSLFLVHYAGMLFGFACILAVTLVTDHYKI